jgi:ankyrin repeat protein
LIDREKVNPRDQEAISVLKQIVLHDDEHKTPDSKIHLSLRRHTDITDAIMEEPWAIDSWDSYGETPLTIACWDRNAEGVRALIAAKARPNLPNFEGDSPLNAACYSGAVECLKALLLAHCDINCSAALFSPVFDCVSSSAPGTVEALEILIKFGAPVSSRDRVDEGSPLHFLADGPGASEKLALLLAHGADVNGKDVKNRTPLHRAIWQSKCSVAQLLLEAKANTKAVTSDQWSVLSYLAAYGDISTIQAFANAKIVEFPDHELRDTSNRTALDIFKWRLYSEDIRSDMKKPMPKDVAAFEALYRGVRDEQLRSSIALVSSAADRLHEEDAAGASELLDTLRDQKKSSGNVEDAETLRVISLQIRDRMWDAAIESLQELAEVWEDRILMAPLED